MLIKKGNTRIVWLLPLFGIVIKFPRIYLRFGFDKLFPTTKKELIREEGVIPFYKKRIFYHPDIIDSFSWYLFGGIYHNWSEFLFFLRTRHGFCQPTYFSLFGLFNIQKFRGQIEQGWVYKEGWWWNWVYFRFLVPIMKNAQVKDQHHFHNQDNFAFYGGKLFLLDYGSRVTRRILIDQRKELETLELPLPQEDTLKPEFY